MFERVTETEIFYPLSSIFGSQRPPTARTGSGLNQESGIPTWSHIRMAGVQVLQPSSNAFPGTPARIWIRSRVTRTWIGLQYLGFQCPEQQLNLLCSMENFVLVNDFGFRQAKLKWIVCHLIHGGKWEESQVWYNHA